MDYAPHVRTHRLGTGNVTMTARNLSNTGGLARVLAVALTFLALLYIASSAWGLSHRGWPGMFYSLDGTVSEVAADGPAARAGIAPGDRVVFSAMPADSRLLAIEGMNRVGGVLHYAIDRGGRTRVVTLQMAAPVKSYADIASYLKRPIAALLCLLSGALVFLRPQRATWAFFLYALGSALYNCNQYWPYPWEFVYLAVDNLGGLTCAALLYFAVAFLHDERRPWHGAIVTAAVAISAAFFLAVAAFAVTWGVTGERYAGLEAISSAHTIWILIETLGTLAILVEALITGRRSRRQRISWVVAGIAYAVIFQTLVPTFFDLSLFGVENVGRFVLYTLDVLSPLAVGVAVTYAMMQYRVVDVRFAFSRALVYAVTTTALVAIFALVEWAASRLFEGTNVEMYAGIVAALLVAFTMNAFHRRVDYVLDVLFFQRERRAAEHIAHLAAALQYADDEATVVRFIVEEPAEWLDLASAAVLLPADDGTFRVAASVGWERPGAAAITRADPIVPQLRASSAPLALHELRWHTEGMPSGVAEALFALPIKARADLFGIVLYGGHANGATINGDERKLLTTLVSSAASAFDHIEAARAREEIQRLSTEVQVLSRLRAAT